jgi:hypothetical protein
LDYSCTKCNYKGPQKKVMGGSKLGSLMWWFIVPSIWEIFSGGMPNISADPLVMMQEMQSSGGGIMQELILSCIPGAGYSIWRRVKKIGACPVCDSKVMVPAEHSGIAGDVGAFSKPHEIEIERKLAEMERKLLEKKPEEKIIPKKEIANVGSVIQAPKNLAQPVNKVKNDENPPAKIEHTEESKKEW